MAANLSGARRIPPVLPLFRERAESASAARGTSRADLPYGCFRNCTFDFIHSVTLQTSNVSLDVSHTIGAWISELQLTARNLPSVSLFRLREMEF